MLKQLYPETDSIQVNDTFMYNAVLKRGPDSNYNYYSSAIHQDYDHAVENYKQSLSCFAPIMVDMFNGHWDKDVVKGMSGIVFWRPIQNEKPLKHMPLTVLDRNTVKIQDTVSAQLVTVTPTG